ncbi:uncharacterized protein [Zea mays]|uniref:uncharacterized protein n=1 Tax=Zea mays TaxID=4577 RepID=UPI001651D44E|nr:uncharacterized protein LOC118473945 [Zea mays]
MVTLENLRRIYGHVVERATLARDLLAPAAGQLSGNLHSRCILAQQLDLSFPEKDDDLRADLEKFGAIEAIALCRHLFMAVIVFRDEASVPVAFRRQEEISSGLYSAVPPPHLALSTSFIHPNSIKVNLYSNTSTASSGDSTAKHSTEPTTTEAATSIGQSMMPLWMESRPATVFQNYLGDGSRFVPSRRSQIYGPTLGADGRLWMEGFNIVQCGNYAQSVPTAIPVAQVPQLRYQSEDELAARRTRSHITISSSVGSPINPLQRSPIRATPLRVGSYPRSTEVSVCTAVNIGSAFPAIMITTRK